MSAVWFHVDLDAFFAAVERLDDPGLEGKPVIVGADPRGRGVVSTCSYEARAFGVHSAMPIGEAWRRCPQAVFLPVRMDRYLEMSERVLAIFRDLCPDVERISIDEAFLDMSGTALLWGPPAEAGRLLKRRVREETGLTVSVGVAANRYVAKIASGLEKPDGLVIVEAGREATFMLGLPLARLWGAGEKTQDRFRDLGILTMGDLVSKTEEEARRLFGEAGGRFLHAACRGQDLPLFGQRAGSRSMSTETTFERDLVDREALEASLLEMACGLAFRLRREGVRARTLSLKLRLSDFSTMSRRRSRDEPYRTTTELFEDAGRLLEKAWNGRSAVRLIGLALELDAQGAAVQTGLFQGDGRREKFEEALFSIEDRGLADLKPARLVGKKDRRNRGHGDATESDDPRNKRGEEAQ